MSQQNVEGLKSFIATAAVSRFRRVKLSSASGTYVEHAGADSDFIGVAQNYAALGEQVTVALRGAGRTFKCVAAAAVTVGAVIYGAASGYVDDAVSGTAIGVALEVATATGDVIECWLSNGAAGDIGVGTLLTVANGGAGVPYVIRKTLSACGDTAIATLSVKSRIIDWWLVSKDTTASNVLIKSGTGTIGANTAKGTTDKYTIRGLSIDDAYQEVAAACVLTATLSAAAGVELYIMALPIA